MSSDDTNTCFVLMPFSDPDGYTPGHFQRVYTSLFGPAIKAAGYAPLRADDITESSLIHVDILRRLLECPMVLCDLTSHNPNVLFELGVRQVFGKPSVLVQETGTRRIFDINPLRIVDYHAGFEYDNVVADQKAISEAIVTTAAAYKGGVASSSIVSLLEVNSEDATRPVEPAKDLQQLRQEIATLRHDVLMLVGREYAEEKDHSKLRAVLMRIQADQYGVRVPPVQCPHCDKTLDRALLREQVITMCPECRQPIIPVTA